MQPADLKAVAAVERVAYQFPWSLGIFRDCLLAGYHCLVLEIGGSVTGYGIMSIAAGEAHLLNLCVHPNAHHLGYGRRLLAAMLTKTLATEVGPAGVRVNAIAPGVIHTNFSKHNYTDAEGNEDPERVEKYKSRFGNMAPLRRVGEAQDVADSILFLCSGAASFMTGQILRPNGGTAMPW